MQQALANLKIYASKVTALQVQKSKSKKSPHEVLEVEGGYQVVNAEQMEQLTAPPAGQEEVDQEPVVGSATTTVTEVASNEPVQFGKAPKGTLLVQIPNARLGKIDLQVANFMGLQRWWKIENYPGIVFDPKTSTAIVPMTARQIKSRKGMEVLLSAGLPAAYPEVETLTEVDDQHEADAQSEAAAA